MNQDLKNTLNKALDVTTLIGGTAVAGGGILTTFNLIKNKKGILPIVAGVVTTLVGFASIKYSLDALKSKGVSLAKASKFDGEVFEPMNFDGEVFEPMNFSGNDVKDFYNPTIGRYMPVGAIVEGKPSAEWTLDMPLDVESSFDGEVFEPMANFNDEKGVNYGQADFYNPKLGRFAPVGVVNEGSFTKEFDITL
jgi:hypothetical protein